MGPRDAGVQALIIWQKETERYITASGSADGWKATIPRPQNHAASFAGKRPCFRQLSPHTSGREQKSKGGDLQVPRVCHGGAGPRPPGSRASGPRSWPGVAGPPPAFCEKPRLLSSIHAGIQTRSGLACISKWLSKRASKSTNGGFNTMEKLSRGMLLTFMNRRVNLLCFSISSKFGGCCRLRAKKCQEIQPAAALNRWA